MVVKILIKIRFFRDFPDKVRVDSMFQIKFMYNYCLQDIIKLICSYNLQNI